MKIILAYARKLRDRREAKTRYKRRASSKPVVTVKDPVDPIPSQLRSPLYEKDIILPKVESPPSYRESCQAAVSDKLGQKVFIQPALAQADFEQSSPCKGEKTTFRGRPKDLLYRSQVSDLRSREPKVPYPRRRGCRVARPLVVDEDTMARLQSCLGAWREETIAMLCFVVLIAMCSSTTWLFF